MIRFFLTFLMVLTCASAAAQTVGPPAGPPVKDEVQAKFEAQLQTPLFLPAIDYNDIDRIMNCRDEVRVNLAYHNCRDSRAIYTAGLKAAKAKGRPLVLIFGFNRCPSCRVLHQQIFNPARPMLDGNVVGYFGREAIENYGRKGDPLNLPFVYIHARSPHGLKLADEIGVSKMAKARGWHRVWSPFIVFVDPNTQQLASQDYWEAPETHCDPMADFAVNLEELGFVETGTPVRVRKRCKRKA